MEKQMIEHAAIELANHSPLNFVREEDAIAPALSGLRLYAQPIVGIADASDDFFEKLRSPGVIGPHFMLPTEWLEGAKTVISVFFPMSDQVKTSNGKSMSWPSNEWLHARHEGQMFIGDTCRQLAEMLRTQGHHCVVPTLDKRFFSRNPITDDKTRQDYYTSNWSERHVAYICGLGTFGLSKGLITRKGVAGRFGSLITDAVIPPDSRAYSTFDEYCTLCGACIKNCPVDAISFAHGKLHAICSPFVDGTQEKYTPRYGCGKCQVKVPCESGIPAKRGD